MSQTADITGQALADMNGWCVTVNILGGEKWTTSPLTPNDPQNGWWALYDRHTAVIMALELALDTAKSMQRQNQAGIA